jgi:MOSC domain-containing protein YiiM
MCRTNWGFPALFLERIDWGIAFIVVGIRSAMDRLVAGSVFAVASSPAHGFSKPTVDRILLVENHGVESDAHAGRYVRHSYIAKRNPRLPNLRQIHLMPVELFWELRTAGYDLRPGELGENVTTTGLKLTELPLGTVIRLGRVAAVELTSLRTPCLLIDRFRKGLRKQMVEAIVGGPKFRCGVLGVVRAGGAVAAGDTAEADLPPRPWTTLPSL